MTGTGTSANSLLSLLVPRLQGGYPGRPRWTRGKGREGRPGTVI